MNRRVFGGRKLREILNPLERGVELMIVESLQIEDKASMKVLQKEHYQ